MKIVAPLEMVMDVLRLARSGKFRKASEFEKAVIEMYPKASAETIAAVMAKMGEIARGDMS